jgi:hypothetical protein
MGRQPERDETHREPTLIGVIVWECVRTRQHGPGVRSYTVIRRTPASCAYSAGMDARRREKSDGVLAPLGVSWIGIHPERRSSSMSDEHSVRSGRGQREQLRRSPIYGEVHSLFPGYRRSDLSQTPICACRGDREYNAPAQADA